MTTRLLTWFRPVLAGTLVFGLAAGCAAVREEAARVVPASAGPVVLEEHRIAALDQGIVLYLREKRPEATRRFGDGEVVLFLEPFGVPTAEAFDVPGLSWMEALAGEGFDAWALDFRGFGRSTRPAAMDGPPSSHPPLVRAAEAVRDLEAAVEYIVKARGVSKVSLVGWSWGGVVAGMYAAEHPERIARLVLYGVMHGFSLPSMTQPLEERPGKLRANLPAYQLATFDMTLHHWRMMMAGRDLAAPEAVAAVERVFLASDPARAGREPKAVRRPMGPMVDLHAIWSGRPLFDAGRITAPVLVIRGDADFFADPTLAGRLTGAVERREVVVQEATHWAIYERNRNRLLAATAEFLRR